MWDMRRLMTLMWIEESFTVKWCVVPFNLYDVSTESLGTLAKGKAREEEEDCNNNRRPLLWSRMSVSTIGRRFDAIHQHHRIIHPDPCSSNF